MHPQLSRLFKIKDWLIARRAKGDSPTRADLWRYIITNWPRLHSDGQRDLFDRARFL